MNYGNRLREIREQRNLSQSELAEKLNRHRNTIVRWEAEITSPNLNDLIDLAAFYSLPVGQLVNDITSPNPQYGNVTLTAKQELELARIFLNQDDRAEFQRAIQVYLSRSE